MADTYAERRSFHIALAADLAGQGWTGANALTFQEGFKSEQPVVPPLVAITFVRPGSKVALQLGAGKNVYNRIIQVDCYMESESRAIKITDRIMDFMDLVPIAISNNSNIVLGSLICHNTDSITSEIHDPLMTNPRALHWRGIIRGTYEASYND